MCGSFVLDADENDLITRYQIRRMSGSYAASPALFPSQSISVVKSPRELERAFWGISVPFLKHRIINSRTEKLVSGGYFFDDFVLHRCLIPATGFFEWKKVGTHKEKYCITDPDEPIFSMAGLYRPGRTGDDIGDYITILTMAADESMQGIHDRMPVIVPRMQEEEYLSTKDIEGLQKHLLTLRPSLHLQNTAQEQLSFL